MSDELMEPTNDDAPPSSILAELRPVRMTNRQKDIIRTLASLMWCDGNASPVERRIVERVIDELHPTPEERIELIRWLDNDCSSLKDVSLEQLKDDEKHLLLTHAVLLTLADDVQLPSEKAMLKTIIDRLALPDEVVQTIIEDAKEDGAVSLPGSVLESVPPPRAEQL